MVPEVSIVMSVYKEKDDFLRDSIRSILNQDFSNFELILVDDGMTQGNIDILEAYDDSRIRVIKNESNIGLTKSLNKGIRESRGEFIARLDSDDWISEKRISSQYEFLKKNSEYVLCGSNHLEKKDGKLVSPITRFLKDDMDLKRVLSSFNPFAHSSLFFRRKTFEEVGGYNEKYECAQDYDLIVKLSTQGKIKNLEQVLTYRNVGHENISSRKNKKQIYYSLYPRIRSFFLFGGSLNALFFLIKSILVLILPMRLTKFLRRTIS